MLSDIIAGVLLEQSQGPYPGFSERAGFAASLAAMVLAALVLYLIFKRKDWL